MAIGFAKIELFREKPLQAPIGPCVECWLNDFSFFAKLCGIRFALKRNAAGHAGRKVWAGSIRLENSAGARHAAPLPPRFPLAKPTLTRFPAEHRIGQSLILE
ncbi:MAG: hypothetical protein GXP03_13155 [Alphaproteobacteria bacterium]|nr:hypothetical protein [Alphaproteobacteria bacterium]